MTRRTWLYSFGIGVPAVVGLALALSRPVPAQQADSQSQQAQRGEQTLTLPVQEGMLQLSVVAPQEVRVGDSYKYEIRVRNTTDDMVLRNVKIKQQNGEKFHIESASIKRQGSQKAEQQKQQQSQAEQQKQQQQNQQQQAEQEKQKQQEQQQAKKQQQQQQKKGEWTIAELNPGETQTIQVTAASDQEGTGNVCLMVTSFTPSLCLTTRFVQPELEIVKRAPETAHLCQDIELAYYVKNTGTGNLKQFQIHDDLGEGLKTVEGNDKLQFTVDGLKPGDTRKFVATVRASEPGEYTSRAIAKVDGEEETRSSRVTTTVENADLAVAIEGPQRIYVNREAHYTVRVTNTGNAPAEQAQLQLQWPAQLARLVDAGEPRQSQEAVGGQSSGGKEPQLAEVELTDERPQPQKQQQQKQKMTSQEWDLGTLKAGQTMQLSFTLRGATGGTLEQRAIARFVCGENKEAAGQAVASTRTEIISLPAIAIAVVDNEDPVTVDSEVTYRIIVQNEGTAPDQKVNVSAELPEQLEFVSAKGASEGKAEGNEVTFQPVETLEAGKELVWTVRAKVKEEGKVRFKVNVESEGLQQTASAEEPTTLFSGKTQTRTSQSEEKTRE